MPLQIYNSFSRRKEEFAPLSPPQVKMYVCGITAYDYCHLGHARAGVIFDMVYRHLRERGYHVQFIRNFTDIDDKIIRRALESEKNWKELAEYFVRAYQEDMARLGNLTPTQEPRATGYITAMQEIIQRLIEKDLAYVSEGDVFFAVKKFPSYGELAQKNLEELEAGARVEVQESKHDPLDFALWKSAKPDEPHWPSPWGEGRPGWHIECSAMSTEILGPTLDIHGGGRDLAFPHHENERAQSEGALGQPFVRHWMHNGFVNLNADKMSKSTGNFLTLRDMLSRYPAEVLRYFMLAAHYRSPLDFNEDSLKDAWSAVERVYETLARWENALAQTADQDESGPHVELIALLERFPQDFQAALDDDFNSSEALAHCFMLIRALNKQLDGKPGATALKSLAPAVKNAFALAERCLGLFGKAPEQILTQIHQLVLGQRGISPEQIEAQLAARARARSERDFARADAIRDALIAQGVLIQDHPDGSCSWSLKP